MHMFGVGVNTDLLYVVRSILRMSNMLKVLIFTRMLYFEMNAELLRMQRNHVLLFTTLDIYGLPFGPLKRQIKVLMYFNVHLNKSFFSNFR